MRKLLFFVMVGILALGFVGCFKKNTLGNGKKFGLDGAPAWVSGATAKEKVYGVGNAQITNNRSDWAMKEATIKARADLASILESKIEEKIKILESAEGSEMVSAIRVSVEQTLSGAQRSDTWISKDGMLWVKVELKTIDKTVLQSNLANLSKINQEAAKALSEVVDEIIDGKK